MTDKKLLGRLQLMEAAIEYLEEKTGGPGFSPES